MTRDDPQEPIDAEEVGWIPDTEELRAVREAFAAEFRAMPITSSPLDGTQVFIATNHTAPYLVDPPHEQLSKFVYDLARKIETRNMAVANEHQYEGETWEEGGFLEELMADIGKAPLAQEYAMKLAFAPPQRSGVGPHKVTHEPTAEWAWCGGKGFCRLCDGVPNP